jgi:probable HAF family extracellular repeat protein
MKLKGLTLFLSAAVIAVCGPIFTITDLGSLGGSSAQAFGLSSNGIAAGAASTAFGYSHAFSSSGSGITDLTLNSAASNGIASGVNSSGRVVGTSFINGEAYATQWANGFAQTFLASGSYATAMNDAGQSTGMFTAPNGHGDAFINSNGTIKDLGDLAGGNWTSAYAINNSGDVAGYGETSTGALRAFIWSEATGYVVLGTLGGTNSYAMGINDSGQVAGSAQTASGYAHAFVSSNGVMQDLGTLGGKSSYAYGINNAAEVVGYSDVNGSSHAFLFKDGLILDLNTLIDLSAGWILTSAYAINGSGQIVGSGLLDGLEHAFRLDYAAGSAASNAQALASATPEPSTWMLFAVGLIGLTVKFASARPAKAYLVRARASRTA